MEIKFKFKTKFGYTRVTAQLINNQIKFLLSPNDFRPFPMECTAEYNQHLLKRQNRASVIIITTCNKLLESEYYKLKEKAMELLPVPNNAINLIFDRIAKGDYSVIKHTL
jgi:hypothetical protein